MDFDRFLGQQVSDKLSFCMSVVIILLYINKAVQREEKMAYNIPTA